MENMKNGEGEAVAQKINRRESKTKQQNWVLKTIVPFGKVTSSCITPAYQINSLVVNNKRKHQIDPILLRNKAK